VNRVPLCEYYLKVGPLLHQFVDAPHTKFFLFWHGKVFLVRSDIPMKGQSKITAYFSKMNFYKNDWNNDLTENFSGYLRWTNIRL
jgi:hypothetical protein